MRAPCLALALALALAALARPAPACAPAPPPGVRVQIAEESAIIVWDAKAQREHFVRRASFHTTGKDFGFLVPTPDKPELAEVPDRVFDQLEAATAPEVIHQTQVGGFEASTLCGSFLLRGGKGEMASAVAPVRVLDAQRVAGYDAVVLEADSAGALASWLKDHGYAERAELSAWLAPYVAAKWKLTAFKIAPGQEGAAKGAVETAAVRMSFATARPFFPYREPSDQRENVPASASGRLLRVFFIGTERVAGSIGEDRAHWPGLPLWSDRFDAERAGGLPFSIPEGAWLTMFEDRASPRPGTDDIFFATAPNQAPLKPPPLVLINEQKVQVPIDVIGVALLVAVLATRRWRKQRRDARKTS
jgi:hypothetical protein